MRTHSLRLLKLVVIALVAGLAAVSGLQLGAEAEGEVLLCSHTGAPCRESDDCARLNPTCFCANISPTTGQGVCRGDFEVKDVSAK